MERPNLTINDDGDGNKTIYGLAINDDYTLSQNPDDSSQLRLVDKNSWTSSLTNQTFDIPSKSLTINLGAGFDKITLNDVHMQTGAALIIDGDGPDANGARTEVGDYFANLVPFLNSGDKIIVNEGKTVSTEGLNGTVGKITFFAESIEIGKSAKLSASTDLGGVAAQSADIRLNARDIGVTELQALSPLIINTKTAKVDIKENAEINGKT